MEFNPGVENKVVRGEVSQILKIMYVDPSKQLKRLKQFQLHIYKLVNISDTQMRAAMKCWRWWM